MHAVSANGRKGCFAAALNLALREVKDLPEADALAEMKPLNLSVADGVLLVDILKRKAVENNQVFGTSSWTPRKIDMVLWTYGR